MCVCVAAVVFCLLIRIKPPSPSTPWKSVLTPSPSLDDKVSILWVDSSKPRVKTGFQLCGSVYVFVPILE